MDKKFKQQLGLIAFGVALFTALLKESIIDGILDEDLYQELCIVFMRCIDRFDP